MSQAPGNLFILAAPSGGGKSSLIKALLAKYNDGSMQVSVSTTTRNMRPGEQDGVHYHFVSKDQFQQQIEAGNLFEWAEVFGNFYGTSKIVIEQTLQQGIDVFLDIDWQGARQVKKALPQTHSIFIAPPSQETLRKRLTGRGQDSEEVIEQRMAAARSEIEHFNEFDYIIVNDDFEQALSELEHIVLAQRCLQTQQSAKHQQLFKNLLQK
ncbi:guanylate kinase [Neptunicella marina]|uniref:Guanylate kinase n=2 Tax=Neptunicella marina TaxID=2125989 RepID=A0A8J6M2M6_9ALTE|nr:guanylate kinase [Neptunicella marina]MBC3766478.1 guanylate kinase [Neptunicella marina]